MTEEEARVVARESVRETLQLFGLDTSNPAELQRDFQFIRSWRTSTEAVKRQGLLVAVSTLVVALIGLIWMAIKGVP